MDFFLGASLGQYEHWKEEEDDDVVKFEASTSNTFTLGTISVYNFT